MYVLLIHAVLDLCVGIEAQEELLLPAIRFLPDVLDLDRYHIVLTLRNTIDWSYDLLSPEEQSLFAQLSVFAGGWSFEAAEAVCNPEGELHLLAGMTSLVEQSLVRQEGEEEPHFVMLETIREYAAEKLAESGKSEQVQGRHAEHYVVMAEEAEPGLRGARQKEWLRRLDRELDNLRGALDWLLQARRVEEELRLAAALHDFWWYRGYWSEAQRWLERGLVAGEGVQPAVRAKALRSAGGLAIPRADYERATALLEEAHGLFQEAGDKAGTAFTLRFLGLIPGWQGDDERATELYERSLALSRAVGFQWNIARVLANLGSIASRQGDFEQARVRFEEALSLYRAIGDRVSTGDLLLSLGDHAFRQGDLEDARGRFEEALALSREQGDALTEAEALASLGTLAREQGDHGQAAARFREALELARELRHKGLSLDVLGEMVQLEVAVGQVKRAARLGGAEAAQREILGIPLEPQNQAKWEERLVWAREALGEEEFTRAWEVGRVMSLEEAVAYALGESG